MYYERITDNGFLASCQPKDVFQDWKEGQERWLFLAPHDDDIILGAGLTFIASLKEKIPTFAGIATKGDSGYCSEAQRDTIAAVREKEIRNSFDMVGLPEENLFFLGYHDCGLEHFTGHFPAEKSPDPTRGDFSPVIQGATGLSNSLVWLFRKVRPTRIFLPTSTDIHPDHQTLSKEAVICVFHAQGTIWPELGAPTDAALPHLYEYSTYSDFVSPPDIRITVPEEILDLKLRGIGAFESQEQIAALIEMQRKAGVREVLRTLPFPFMQPGKYDALFDTAAARARNT